MHVHLEPITAQTIGDCLLLRVAPHQKHFVASNTVSLIQSLVEPAFVPRAIYAGDRMVGFVMYGRDPASGQDWIVRLMIDARYQGRGYGHAGLLAALDALAQQPGGNGTFVSYRPEDLAAAFTYAGVGFRPTSTLPDGEIVAERTVANGAPAAPVVAGIVLAAGAASRMGQPKQLLDWDGQPLVRAAAAAALAAGLFPVLVVVGHARGAVAEALAGLPVHLVVNEDYAQGQSTSLRAGIAALGHSVAAAVVLLGDQPFVTPAIVERLLAVWQNGDGAIVAPVYAGQRGNPVLFARTIFPELLAVQGDQGARSVLAANRERVALVPFDDARPLADIDTPEEYARLRQSAGSSAQSPEVG
jgi:molybdenum cofactor cytidylyltransferase